MKIMVTGGAGFIGSALTHHLVERGEDEVIVVDSFTYAANPASLAPLEGHKGFGIVRQDIRDARAVMQLVTATRPDAIMHLAVQSHVDRSIAGYGDYLVSLLEPGE